MARYNTCLVDLACPRCGATGVKQVNLYFGLRDLTQYAIGDAIRWAPKGGPAKGGRPHGGDLDGDSYGQCLACQKDFFAIARVRAGRLVAIEPDPTRRPHVP